MTDLWSFVWDSALAREARVHLRRAVRSRAGGPGWAGWLAAGAEAYLAEYWNRCRFDLEDNGEAWLLRRLAAAGLTPVVFDVGANEGEYAASVLRSWARAEVHAFEIVPAVAGRLARRFEQEPRVLCRAFGLSDRAAVVKVHCLPGDTSASGIMHLHTRGASVVDGRVEQGDAYLQARGTPRLGLLKVDVEGHELAVLKGFAHALAARQVEAIQFEYGITHLPSRTFLRDFYDLLEPHDYAVGRLLPQSVRFASYDPVHDESHVMGNYVAVPREGPAWRALRAST